MEQNKNLTNLHTFGVAWKSDYFMTADSLDSLGDAISFLQDNPMPVMVLGGGSNILPTERLKGLVIHNQLMGREIVDEDDSSVTLRIASGELWHELVAWCVEHGYYGVENLALIPGTVGGAVVQNIGAYDVAIEQFVESVAVVHMTNGESDTFTRDRCDFSYRNSIFKQHRELWAVTSVDIKLSKQFTPTLTYQVLKEIKHEGLTAQDVFDEVVRIRQSKLPDWNMVGTAGSFFANPRVDDKTVKRLRKKNPDMPVFNNYNNGENTIPAGWLIEHSGLDQRVRDDFLYEKHALVLINKYKGQDDLPQKYGKQIEHAVLKIKNTVQRDFGITLEPEVLIL